ncbi:L-ascorbate oxidase [Tanacetum coccineum]|uniref:L-ascorbate oxidase n=1 Tax=Tanacetum coccineum TaxID=301880 RepID=A0ABQ5I2W4_9ASTR
MQVSFIRYQFHIGYSVPIKFLLWLQFTIRMVCYRSQYITSCGTSAATKSLVLLGDEVYQQNVYQDERPFVSSRKGILINGQFPAPTIYCVTNDNVIVNVINKLNEPFLITWPHGKTACWGQTALSHQMQMKDQIGSYSYFPSTNMHKAAGAFGALNIQARAVIFVPYLKPVEEFTVLARTLDSGMKLPMAMVCSLTEVLPERLLLQSELYMFRVLNVALTTSVNFRIQGHTLTLVETEGSHTLQEAYESFDLHVGQSASFLVKLHAPVKDYFIACWSYLSDSLFNETCQNNQNLTANAARPNPQGSYHYGTIPVTRTIVFANSKVNINGKLRYAVNQVSYVNPSTPLKIADFYIISGVFSPNSIKDTPPSFDLIYGVSVLTFNLHDYVEFIFQNNENTIQSWHLDGSDFWTVGFGSGVWNSTLRKKFYNLNDSTTRHTVQCNIGFFGQQGNVESEVYKLAKAIPGTRVVSSSLE